MFADTLFLVVVVSFSSFFSVFALVDELVAWVVSAHGAMPGAFAVFLGIGVSTRTVFFYITGRRERNHLEKNKRQSSYHKRGSGV